MTKLDIARELDTLYDWLADAMDETVDNKEPLFCAGVALATVQAKVASLRTKIYLSVKEEEDDRDHHDDNG